MEFNIRAAVAGEEPDEEAVEEYTEQLCALFMRSPEAKALDEQEDDFDGFFWANAMIGYGINYCGVTPADMTAADFDRVLFDIIPRKVSCDAAKAPEMVAELKAFWKFVEREYALPNAAECLGVLSDGAEKRLESKLANPANFGMAKSFFMAGKEAGFDVETEAGLNAWMTTYNSSLTGQRPLGPGLPSVASKVGTAADEANRQRLRDERKKKRQQRKASQRRNR